MLNSQKNALVIFENFQIDFMLPKWKARFEEQRKSGDFSGTPNIQFDGSIARAKANKVRYNNEISFGKQQVR